MIKLIVELDVDATDVAAAIRYVNDLVHVAERVDGFEVTEKGETRILCGECGGDTACLGCGRCTECGDSRNRENVP